MEQTLTIKARDGLDIDGILYGNSDKLIIIGHGLADSARTTYVIRHSVNLLLEQGFSIFTISFYSKDKDRSLTGKVTVKRHAEDMQDVYNHFKEKFNKIFLVGYSFGGLALARANIKSLAQALWDPTFHADVFRKEEGPVNYINGKPTVEFSNRIITINNDMVEDAENITFDIASKYSKQITTPTILINSSQFFNWNKHYHDYITNCEIKTVDCLHDFAKLGATEELVKHTVDFFKKF